MTLKEYFSAHYGSQQKFADALGVSVGFVSHMATGRRPVPIAYCAQIEKITGGQVTRRDLRPNDFAEIWPELATA